MRRTLAGLAAGAVLIIAVGSTGPGYVATCHAPTEDSRVSCHLDPSARYSYDRGAWRLVADGYRHANGNRPPTGRQVMTFDPDR